MEQDYCDIMGYLQENFLAEVGQVGVLVFGALRLLAKRGTVRPTYEEVGEMAGCGESLVRRTLDALAEHSIVTKTARRDSKGANCSNHIKLNDPDLWSHAGGVVKSTTPPVVEFTTGGGVVDFTTGYKNSNGDEDMAQKGGVVELNTPPLYVSSSSLFLDLNTRDQSTDRSTSNIPTSSLASGVSRDTRARMTEPEKTVPTPNSGPYDELCALWRRNGGVLREAVEKWLQHMLLKYNLAIMTEALDYCFANYTDDPKYPKNQPNTRYIETMAEKYYQEEQATLKRHEKIMETMSGEPKPVPKADWDGATRLGKVGKGVNPSNPKEQE